MLIRSISSAASSQTLSGCDMDMRVIWVDGLFFVCLGLFFFLSAELSFHFTGYEVAQSKYYSVVLDKKQNKKKNQETHPFIK